MRLGSYPAPPAVLNGMALLLDFDGTLVDIAATPGQVIVPDGLVADLTRLSGALGGAIAIVSGRPIAELDALLAPMRLAAAGEHGAAIRNAPDAATMRPALPVLPPVWREVAAECAHARPGVVVEQKAAGLVLHYRLAPGAGPMLRQRLMQLLEEDSDFEIMEATAAWEVRPRGIDKGRAVRCLMRHAPFRGRVPLYIGDDVTDEDGMAAARALGGLGLRVQESFGNAAGVRAWLGRMAHGMPA